MKKPPQSLHEIKVSCHVFILSPPYYGNRQGIVVSEAITSTNECRVWRVQHGLNKSVDDFKDSQLIRQS